MAFLNDEEKKEFGGGFFKWVDGRTYRMFIDKKVEERFSDGKKFLNLLCTDRETGETHELKYQFDLIQALEQAPFEVKPDTAVTVSPKLMGTKIVKGKEYDDFQFIVALDTEPLADKSDESGEEKVKTENIPF